MAPELGDRTNMRVLTRYAPFIWCVIVVTMAIGISFRLSILRSRAKGHHSTAGRRRRSIDLSDYPTRSIRSRRVRAVGRGQTASEAKEHNLFGGRVARLRCAASPRRPRISRLLTKQDPSLFFLGPGLRSITLNAGYVIVFTHP